MLNWLSGPAENRWTRGRETGQVSIPATEVTGGLNLTSTTFFPLSGGRIDWNDRRFKESGEEFQLVVKSVNIECYDAYSSRSAFKYHYNGTADNRLSLEVTDL